MNLELTGGASTTAPPAPEAIAASAEKPLPKQVETDQVDALGRQLDRSHRVDEITFLRSLAAEFFERLNRAAEIGAAVDPVS